jgi:hypothetical protein
MRNQNRSSSERRAEDDFGKPKTEGWDERGVVWDMAGALRDLRRRRVRFPVRGAGRPRCRRNGPNLHGKHGARAGQIWVGDEAVHISRGRSVVLLRFDLEKRITLNPERELFLAEPLAEAPSAAPEEPERIQEVGWDYVPDYDWTLRDTGEERVVDGRTRRLVVLEGDADYAEEVRELWVSGDVPVDVDRYFRLVASREPTGGLPALFERTPILRDGFIVESRTTTENPIAPTIILETRVVKMETAEPPPGIYEVPPDYQEVGTVRDLFPR